MRTDRFMSLIKVTGMKDMTFAAGLLGSLNLPRRDGNGMGTQFVLLLGSFSVSLFRY